MDHKLEHGQVCKGIVTAVSDYSLSVTLTGGLQGTVSSANLSWRRVDHPSEVAQVDQVVTVFYLSTDPERESISLSLKDIEPDPLIEFARTELDAVTRGTVTKIAPIGTFVRLPSGIEGLLPTASSGAVAYKLGDEFEVKVDYINMHTRQVRVSLGA
ncbi:S1 RNA-binding domain-containing protein [Streptomyces erythrochromogenes]|uniref:S1 RNA-binding domain-containing protein n=1 Tax=Streptomyces erythrochromogenes TaxID=285574 RepID=UPI00342DB1B1